MSKSKQKRMTAAEKRLTRQIEELQGELAAALDAKEASEGRAAVLSTEVDRFEEMVKEREIVISHRDEGIESLCRQSSELRRALSEEQMSSREWRRQFLAAGTRETSARNVAHLLATFPMLRMTIPAVIESAEQNAGAIGIALTPATRAELKNALTAAATTVIRIQSAKT